MRVPITGNDVKDELERRGWKVEPLDTQTWRTRFMAAEQPLGDPAAVGELPAQGKTSKSQRFPIVVHVDETQRVLRCAVVPYGRSPEERPRAENLYRRLLELNHRIMMAKFAIDDELDVILLAEYPIDELDPSELNDCLESLSYYAHSYFDELVAAGLVPG